MDLSKLSEADRLRVVPMSNWAKEKTAQLADYIWTILLAKRDKI